MVVAVVQLSSVASDSYEGGGERGEEKMEASSVASRWIFSTYSAVIVLGFRFCQ